MALSQRHRELLDRAEGRGSPLSRLEVGALDAVASGVVGEGDVSEKARAKSAVIAARKRLADGGAA